MKDVEPSDHDQGHTGDGRNGGIELACGQRGHQSEGDNDEHRLRAGDRLHVGKREEGVRSEDREDDGDDQPHDQEPVAPQEANDPSTPHGTRLVGLRSRTTTL